MNYEELDSQIRTFTENELYLRDQYLAHKKRFIKSPQSTKASSPSHLGDQNQAVMTSHTINRRNYLSEERFILPDMTMAIRLHPRYLSTAPHQHEFLELVYVYDGCCLQSFENKQITMQKGDVCILAPNLQHSISSNDDDSIIVNILVRRSTFDTAFANLLSGQSILADFFARILYEDRSKQYILFHTHEDNNLKKIVMDMIQEANTSAKYSDLMLKSYLMLFLGQLLRDHEQDALTSNTLSSYQKDVLALLQYIQNNYHTVTLSQISDYFGFNYTQTSRLIKDYTGRTFSELRREMRLHKARELLLNPSLPIEDIAEAAGFHDISHFYRDFKHFYNMTPTAYRAKEYKD